MKKKTTLLEPVKYQSFSHWFSYHWGIVPIALVLIFLAWFSWNGRQGPKADYSVGWVGRTMLTEEEEQALSDAVAALGSDRNGDGTVLVEVLQYMVDFDMEAIDSNAETNYSYVLKLVNELQLNTCYLYLMEDPEGFQRATGALRYLDGSVPGEEEHFECARWEEMCAPFQLEGRAVWLGRRSLIGEEADYDAVFPDGEAMFQSLAAQNEPAAQP